MLQQAAKAGAAIATSRPPSPPLRPVFQQRRSRRRALHRDAWSPRCRRTAPRPRPLCQQPICGRTMFQDASADSPPPWHASVLHPPRGRHQSGATRLRLAQRMSRPRIRQPGLRVQSAQILPVESSRSAPRSRVRVRHRARAAAMPRMLSPEPWPRVDLGAAHRGARPTAANPRAAGRATAGAPLPPSPADRCVPRPIVLRSSQAHGQPPRASGYAAPAANRRSLPRRSRVRRGIHRRTARPPAPGPL